MAVNIKDINIENIDDWPIAIRLACISIVFVLIFAAGYWFLIQSSIDQLDRAEKKELALKNKINIRIDQTSNLVAYISQMNELNKMFEGLLGQLPDKKEIPALLEDITMVGLQSGLVFKLIRPSPGKVTEFYETIPIQIEVEGTYDQLGEFAGGISSLSRIVTIADFSIKLFSGNEKDVKDKALVMNISAKTYRYLTLAEQKSYAAAKRAKGRKR